MTRRSNFTDAVKRAAKVFVCSTASIGLAASASAADWPTKVPEIPNLSWNGITIIGAVDVSAQYQQYGSPYKGDVYTPGNLIQPQGRSSQLMFAPNQSFQSFIGFKVDKELTSDLSFTARFEAGFNPTSGQLSDALKSVQANNGIALTEQSFGGDGPRAGQIFNGDAWVGLDSKTWGKVHIGRNAAVGVDMVAAYDPLASYGFSLLSYIGFIAGQGGAETARLDQSVKYLNNWGPIRVEAMYAHPDSNAKDFYQGSIGYVTPQFSVDLLLGQAHDQIFVTSLSNALPGALGSPFFGARVFDSTMIGGFGKYVFMLGGNGPLNTPESKFTLSGGYARTTLSNPADGGRQPGFTTIGGYQIGPALSTNGSSLFGIVNYTYTGGDRQIDTSFIGAKYQYDSQWTFGAAYYRFDTNSFGHGVNGVTGGKASSFSNVDCSSASFFNCSGNEQVASIRADYQYTKNLMFYAGVSYSRVSGGFAFGYLHNSTYSPTVGARLTF